MQRVQISYEGAASSVPHARHAVERALQDWGLDELCWTAALLVSELAANVTLHAHTAFTVVLERLPGGGARLEVRDASVRLPRPRRFGEQATTGRGLRLVEDLSVSWGVDLTEGGKAVWAVLAAVPSRASSDADPHVDADLDALLLAFPDLDDDAPSARTRTA